MVAIVHQSLQFHFQQMNMIKQKYSRLNIGVKAALNGSATFVETLSTLVLKRSNLSVC